MKNILIIILISMLAISCGPSKEELQLREISSQIYDDSLSSAVDSDSTRAEKRLVRAQTLALNNYYDAKDFKKDGHLYFGRLSEGGLTDSKSNWLVHDPECPKCLARR